MTLTDPIHKFTTEYASHILGFHRVWSDQNNGVHRAGCGWRYNLTGLVSTNKISGQPSKYHLLNETARPAIPEIHFVHGECPLSMHQGYSLPTPAQTGQV